MRRKAEENKAIISTVFHKFLGYMRSMAINNKKLVGALCNDGRLADQIHQSIIDN
jgi:hypothetical protein